MGRERERINGKWKWKDEVNWEGKGKARDRDDLNCILFSIAIVLNYFNCVYRPHPHCIVSCSHLEHTMHYTLHT